MEEELNSLSVSKKEKMRMHLLLVGRDRYGDPCLQVRPSGSKPLVHRGTPIWINATGSSCVVVRGEVVRRACMCGQVNFHEHSVMLFKEVRNLVWLGFRVPAAIIHLSDEVRALATQQSGHFTHVPSPHFPLHVASNGRRPTREELGARRVNVRRGLVGNPGASVWCAWCVVCPVVEALPLRHGPAGYSTHLSPDATGHHAGQGGAAYRTPQGTTAPLNLGMTAATWTFGMWTCVRLGTLPSLARGDSRWSEVNL